MSKVYLVGAGPGDPLLITVKGRQVLERADAVLYDHLANEALLHLAPRSADRIYVGKKRADHAVTQEEITSLMIERARAGQTVVRLKGGDPYLFGRGGEEAEALHEAGVDFEVVPGVTSPSGIAAYTGVPLTHREHTSVVTFVTGHHAGAVDWARVSAAETLVILMGITAVDDIAAKLIQAGRAPDTPAMAVRWGTRPMQTVITSTLVELPARIHESGMKPPATIIIGEVVRLRDKLNWFERLPLFGQRIVVTRAAEQAGELTARLWSLGAEAVELATIAFEPPTDTAPLDAAIANLESYDWLIFTSANGVRFFLERLDASARDLRAIRARLCAIGPATSSALERLHLKVDLMPRDFVAESLLEAFSGTPLEGKRILLPRAAVARDLIPTELTRLGAHVDVVEAYQTVTPEFAHEHAREVFTTKPDWILFTSTSTVNNFISAAGRNAIEGVKVATIGPITSDAARRRGIEVTVEASPYTIDGLVDKIVSYNRLSLET
ncbi:MAG: uroporphyrinogen-III C-methyltransferase [Acidobacteriia bacterium]|nr:uroporphyrinogen-III C-methyltransferase [Terriglobia bacterium]